MRRVVAKGLCHKAQDGGGDVPPRFALNFRFANVMFLA